MSLPVVIEGLAREGKLYPSLILYGGAHPGAAAGSDRGGDVARSSRVRAAMRLARILLCDVHSEDPENCVCRHCRRISMTLEESVFHPDVHILRRDLKTATSAEGARSLMMNAQLSPFEARGQVFVIVEADSLTDEAANALLKILEEPPRTAPRNFLLLCSSREQLLPTIRSRSMAFYLGAPEAPDSDTVAALAERFSSCLEQYGEADSPAFLLAASQILFESAKWEDPRAASPWILAATCLATAHRESLIPRHLAPAVLALAADLLVLGPQMRVRNVPAQRILDGLVSRHLAVLAD